MTIETTHRGYTLRMSEDTEAWSCEELEIDGHAMLGLKSLKAMIDKMFKDGRKLGDLKVLMLSGGAGRFADRVKVTEVTATLLCAPKKDWSTKEEVIKYCWVTTAKGERIKCSIEGLYPVEARPQVEAWRALCVEADAAVKRADEAEKALPAFKSADNMMRAAREAKVVEADENA